MFQAIVIQLPVPQISFGRLTGNIPLAGACLRQAARHLSGVDLQIMPESVASYLGDAAVLAWVLERKPDLIGFSTYVWNIRRVLDMARRLKASYGPLIVLGGPEITPDNPLIDAPHIDHCIHGAGEAAFVHFLQRLNGLAERSALPAQHEFEHCPSPYLTIPLEHRIERMMLLETTRGCPYHCAYCYYNKASRSLAFKEDRHVLEGVSWAAANAIEEIYFLDPSLNVRPDLRSLLEKIAACNPDRRMALSSELRAESVDAELAARLAAAGFRRLEIGLQTTNPQALECIRRPTDLKRFAEGIVHLKKHGISCSVDLIVGLPGDTPSGFERTVQFVRDNHFDDAIQVFPLSILPGTEFRRSHRTLGLSYDPDPPYLVTRTRDFTLGQMRDAFELAEAAFETSLYPRPDLDASWRPPGCEAIENAGDIAAVIDGRPYVYKVMLHPHRGLDELHRVALQVTHPYQILIPPALADIGRQAEAIDLFSECNPHTPFEVIFYDPQQQPQTAALLRAVRLHRPHYLDGDLRFANAAPGNRAVLFTLVSSTYLAAFDGPDRRSVYWWRSERLPDMDDFFSVERGGYEGILIDPQPPRDVGAWQDRMAPAAGELPAISFAAPCFQRRWVELTARDAYYPAILPG